MTRTTTRIIAAGIAALLTIALLWWAVDRLFFAPGRAKAVTAAAEAGAVVATGRQAAAEDATKIVERYHDRTTEIRTIQTEGVAAVAAALDDAAGGAAARRAICLLDRARQLSDPACELFETGAEIGAGADAGVAAAAR
jgi:hypothetical protein